MQHYAGIDVSLELSSVCVVDALGAIVKEAKVASDPEALAGWFKGLGFAVKQIAPIWKREFFEGGDVWIEGATADPADEDARARAERVACA